MSYDAINSEVKKPTPRVSSGTPRVTVCTPWLLRARTGIGGFSFNGAGDGVASATVRTTGQSTTGGREGG